MSLGDAVNKVDPSYTATTANFSVGFTQPGDSITYDITVTNKGTLDAVVESINVVKGDNQAITYTTNDITVTINYQQDLGQVPAYEAYSIGDTIEFVGSNWRVIKNSTMDEDYVTLMKETVLTNSQLGSYEYNETYDTMEFTWRDNCHQNNHGYSSNDYSNCDNTNIYDDSKVKEMMDTRYLPMLGENNLKEVDGYKIRLITLNELQENLGISKATSTTWYTIDKSKTPGWVYEPLVNYQNNVSGYWTMTPNPTTSFYVFKVYSTSVAFNEYATTSEAAVRPVINLLKSSIE